MSSPKGDANMSIQKIEDRILQQLDGELSPDEEREFFAELAAHPVHAALYEEYQRQEQGLQAYYGGQAQEMARAPKPELSRARIINTGWSPLRRFQYAAAAAVVVSAALGGVAYIRGHSGNGEFGSILTAQGPAQVIGGGGGLAELNPNDRLDKDSRRIKTGTRGYMEVALPAKSGTLEMNANTTVKFAREGKGSEVIQLERGEVVLAQEGEGARVSKVRTPDLEVNAPRGAVSVVRGVRGTEVAVLFGEAEVVTGGVRKRLGPGESFSSVGARPVDVTGRFAWSRRERVAPSGGSGAASAAGSAASAVTSARSANSLLAWLPAGTFAFVEVPSITQLLAPTGASSPADFLQSGGALDHLDFGGSLTAEEEAEARRVIAAIVADNDLRTILASLTGGAVVGFTQQGPVFLVDVSADPQGVAAALDSLRARLAGATGQPASEFPVEVLNSTLIFGVPCPGFAESREALATGTPTLFASSQFASEVGTATANSSIKGALSVKSLVAQAQSGSQGESVRVGKMLSRTGLSNMRTIMAATDFGDQAGNQAIRVTFDGPREGMVAWLDAPGGMTTLKAFSPSTHALGVMKVRDPEQMLDQVLTWIGEDAANFRAPETAQELAAAKRLAASLGNEVAFGLDNPVLPIPNLKFATEVLDPQEFHSAMVDVMDLLWQVPGATEQLTVTTSDYRNHMIVELKLADQPWSVSYAVVEDIAVFGPGKAFVQGTLDTVLDNRSIDQEYAFTQSLPASSGSHVSSLSYFAVDQQFADALPLLAQFDPSFNDAKVQQSIRSSAADGKGLVIYSIAEESAIDFFVEGVRVGDYRLASAMPVVAEWIEKRK